jgi:putative membrane protein
MKLLWGLGKLSMVAFWTIVITSAFMEVPRPAGALIDVAASVLLATHLLELILFNGTLRGRPHAWRDRGKIVLFGIFHIQSIGRTTAERSHA